MSQRTQVEAWVDSMARLCAPARVAWCDGSDAERKRMTEEALRCGDLEALNQEKLPGCYLHRSAANDVARSEALTFICTRKETDAGPTNNWMAPKDAYEKLGAIFKDSMKGRTMYVIPFLMGPAGSPFSKVGIQLTDSVYVALNMRIMTRVGPVALAALEKTVSFTRCLHGKADLDPERRFICHFPEDDTVWSVGSGYGGNALLGKKCLALRIGSFLGRSQGWMAEHMMIVGVESPAGETHYIAGAFPSACGKTNLAMLIPPKTLAGWKVRTVGDDIAWIRPGPGGRLWALNPEAGFFGVAPGTSRKTNPNAMATMSRNTIYTNVLKKPDGTVWWEGMDGEAPAQGTDWRGRPWTSASPEKGAHPNSRFTAPARQCPSISPKWEDPQGVPLSAILFGGRRKRLTPLIYQSFNWQHGTFVGATMTSATTAAAVGAVGVVRRDPMAMRPFCGYNMADYFAHWLKMGASVKNPPKIFHVNWFRKGPGGEFLWPGFGENLRAILWVLERIQGKGEAKETPIGYVPTAKGLNLEGLDIPADTLRRLLAVDPEAWLKETGKQARFFSKFGDRLPRELAEERKALVGRLTAALTATGGAKKRKAAR